MELLCCETPEREEENREVEDGFLIWKNLCGKLIGGKWDFLGGGERRGNKGKGVFGNSFEEVRKEE